MAKIKYERLGVICQVCSPEAPKVIRTEPIALFDPSNMPAPMNGMNFFPIKPGMSSPFLAGQGWEFMTCPFCHTRPFLNRNQICTPKGMFTIGEEFVPDRALLTKEELAEIELAEYQEEMDAKAAAVDAAKFKVKVGNDFFVLDDMSEAGLCFFAAQKLDLILDSRDNTTVLIQAIMDHVYPPAKPEPEIPDYDDITVKEIKAELDDLGVDYEKSANKTELYALFTEAVKAE